MPLCGAKDDDRKRYADDTEMGGMTMLLDGLQRCIEVMDEVRLLEQASKDLQKQSRADQIYASIVTENHKVVAGIEERRKYVHFKPSEGLKAKIAQAIEATQEAARSGLFQETKAKALQNDTKIVKEMLSSEWGQFYSALAERKVSTLMTVQSITPDKGKTRLVINAIRNGASIDHEDHSKVRALASGLADADQILEGLGLDDEVMGFLNKVSGGSATIYDLTESLIMWIQKEDLSKKFKIGFKD